MKEKAINEQKLQWKLIWLIIIIDRIPDSENENSSQLLKLESIGMPLGTSNIYAYCYCTRLKTEEEGMQYENWGDNMKKRQFV